MKQRFLFRVGVLLFSFAVCLQPLAAYAAEVLVNPTPSWLSDVAPRVIKTADLLSNAVPYVGGIDCQETTLVDPKDHTSYTGCSISTGAGPILSSAKYTDGKNYVGLARQGFVQSYGDKQLAYSAATGYTYMYPALKMGDLVYAGSSIYTFSPSSSQTLKRTNGDVIWLSSSTMAYSANGQWLVAYASAGSKIGGIMVFDTKTYASKLIAPMTTYNTLNGGNDTPGAGNLAISDDGRYVATSHTQENATRQKEKGLRVYDTTTCADQTDVATSQRTYCSYKNVWTGKMNGTTQVSVGIQEQLPQTVERPLNIRFKDTNTLTFSGIYDYISLTNLKVASYEATMVPLPPPPPPPKKILAVGDSYISGEGALSYREGTDTSNNKCHQSTVSYPYLLGAQYFSEGNYHSVACSGAVTEDILNDRSSYDGQTTTKIPWDNRDNKDNITNNYIPGYANQLKFIAQDNPDVVLLSIGGNDVHFADIVSLCVLSGPTSPCFSSRSEREQLLEFIYTRHNDLTYTYSQIMKDAPNRRLYIMGYPQVVSTTGSCGVNVHLDDSERQFGTLLIDRINATIKNAAESVGAKYVDISQALNGHRLCDATADGMNGLTNGDDNGLDAGVYVGNNQYYFGIGNESYHPTAFGHSLIAATIADKTNGLEAPMPAATGAGMLRVNSNDQFLTEAGQDTNTVRRMAIAMITPLPYMFVTSKMQIKLNVALANIPPDQSYEAVLHSDEVKIAEGKVGADGTIETTVTIPRISYGAHMLNIYTTDKQGTPIAFVQVVYIGVNKDDLDGDGILNVDDPQPFINETGAIIGELPVDPPVDAGGTGDTGNQDGSTTSGTGSGSDGSGAPTGQGEGQGSGNTSAGDTTSGTGSDTSSTEGSSTGSTTGGESNTPAADTTQNTPAPQQTTTAPLQNQTANTTVEMAIQQTTALSEANNTVGQESNTVSTDEVIEATLVPTGKVLSAIKNNDNTSLRGSNQISSKGIQTKNAGWATKTILLAILIMTLVVIVLFARRARKKF